MLFTCVLDATGLLQTGAGVNLEPVEGIQSPSGARCIQGPVRGRRMKSLVVLMIEMEQPEGLSSRKLIIETAKHNVLTAYDAEVGLDLLRRFPNVDLILVHSSLLMRRKGLLSEVKSLAQKVPIVLASPFKTETHHPEVRYVVDSHNPQELLTLLSEYVPDEPLIR